MKFGTELMTGLCTLLSAGTAYGFEVLGIAVGGPIHKRTTGLTSVKKKRGKKATNIFTHINFMHLLYRLMPGY
jgi:hypothetical protein